MATKVEAKVGFSGSMMDLNNGLFNGMWDRYHSDRISGPERSQCYDPFLMRQTMDGYPGYPKEQMRKTMLKQDSIFRHQVQELHRLYKIQRDLMNKVRMPAEASKSTPFLSQVPSQRIIDLELPAHVGEYNEGKHLLQSVHILNKKRGFNLADLNEPFEVDEASFAASHIIKNSNHCVTNNGILSHQSNLLQAEPKKAVEHLSRKRTIFGVELFESSHTPSFNSSQTSLRDQNTSTPNYNRWIGSSDASRQIQEDFASNKCASNRNSRFMTTSHQNGFIDGKKNHESLEKRLPHWLMPTKGKEMTLYQMNLDSLQHHSQQFFKKAETTKDANGPKITKILGVPITDVTDNFKDPVKESSKSNHISELRHHIDLNLAFDEEEDPSSTPYNIPEAVVKIASMEIDLETPATLEPETDDTHEELAKAAAEAIIDISSFEEPPPTDTLLMWLAEVITSDESDGKDSSNVNNDEEFIPEGMDYFEYMTLKLQETKEEYECYKPMILEEKEEDEGLLKKRTTRKGQGKRGRQRKDFQRDVLPGIVSLSRQKVTEDIHTLEEAFSGIGDSWQSGLSKRKAAGKNGRGRRRLVVPTPPSPTPSLSPPPQSPAVEIVCREVALEEKSLSGWGKRTRRLPRQRCQNGSSHHSLTLKC